MLNDHVPPQPPAASAETPTSLKPKFKPVMQIELAPAKTAALGKAPTGEAALTPGATPASSPAGAGEKTPLNAMPPDAPGALAFRPGPRFEPILQIPAASVRPQARAPRWKLHGGRLATLLGTSTVVVIVIMGFILVWSQVRLEPGSARTSSVRPPASSQPAATATPSQSTAAPSTATPDLAATLSVAVAATLTAQPPPALSTVAPQSLTSTPASASAALSPTPFINQGALAGATDKLFDESFTLGGYWDTGDTPYALREIRDGQLQLQIKKVGDISWSFNGISGSDFYVQAVTTASSCRAGDYYGLAFRVRNDGDFYMFGISCDGRYRVMLQKDGQFTSLIDFTFSPDIVAFGGYNLLGVRAVGDQFSFYVNDQFLASTTDDAFAEGRFGVFAKSFVTPNLTIYYDDITAWSLKP